jgi:protoporphyrinogen oxidase
MSLRTPLDRRRTGSLDLRRVWSTHVGDGGASSTSDRDDADCVVIGAGPAGLTAAHALTGRGWTPVVLESDTVVGGIARTVERDGWRFDIGGHRFFTKVPRVEELWREILPDEHWMTRQRTSRILYDGKFFDYPLSAGNVVASLGPVEATRCIASYLAARIRPPRDQSHFEGWVAARFGWRLYRMFFETYTEKVWGIHPTEIGADWAAQRIKNLSLLSAVVDALTPRSLRSNGHVTSLITSFEYPTHGPGMVWESCHEIIERRGGQVSLNTRVDRIRLTPGAGPAARALEIEARDTSGEPVVFRTDHAVSTMPLGRLVQIIDPAPPAAVLRAADDLRHRDFLTVALVVPRHAGFPDNWIYIHSPAVRVGRVQNYGSWSPHMVQGDATCLGLEYFVNEGDDLWEMDDHDLVRFAGRELDELGLARAEQVRCGYVVRMPQAYPVYDERYQRNIDTIRTWLGEHAPSIHPVGRNGMHRYNNQDHSMMTALLAVENIVDDAGHDTWGVNVDEDYHEEIAASTSGTAAPDVGSGRAAPILSRPTSTTAVPR